MKAADTARTVWAHRSAAAAFAMLCLAVTVWAAPIAERPANSAQVLYLLHCSGCHGVDGMGDPRVDVPPFPGFIGEFLKDPEGRRYVTNVGGVMSAGLTDRETAEVLTWVMTTFGRDSLPASISGTFEPEEVRDLRARRPADLVALRREIAERLARQGVELPAYPWP